MKVYIITVMHNEKPQLIRQEAFFSFVVALEMYRRAVAVHTEPMVTLNTTDMNLGALGPALHELGERTRVFGFGMATRLIRGALGHWARKKAGKLDGP